MLKRQRIVGRGIFWALLWFSALAPGLKLLPILHNRQPFWEWCTIPSPKRALQSCPFWRQVTQSIATTSSDFFALLSNPSSFSITAPGRYCYGWLWQVPTKLTTCWCFSSNKAFALSPGCKSTMCCLAPAGGRCLGRAQKGYLDERWEVTLIPALKRKIKEKAGKFPFQWSSSTRSRSNWQFAPNMAFGQSNIRHRTILH